MRPQIITCLLATIFLISNITPSSSQTPQQLFQKGLIEEEGEGDLYEAIDIFNRVVKNQDAERSVQAKALLHVGLCYEKLGKAEATKVYYQVLNNFPTYKEEVAIAQERLEVLEANTAHLMKKAKRHMKEGNELFKRWEYESAIKEYKTAIELVPNSSLAQNAQFCVGQSLFKAGRYDKAMATFEGLVEKYPESAIVPVSELMLTQVQYVLKNIKTPEMKHYSSDENMIVDEKTGIRYTKIKTFVGQNDWISYTTEGFNMSPDGRFMVLENKVVPTDGSDPFTLVDMDVHRAVYAPNMRKAAFYADNAIWIVPVSPETGRSTGQPEKLLEGNYKYQFPVSWSPNGEKIAFSRRDENINAEIWTISVSDGSLTRVSEGDGNPVWSPSGKLIAFRKKGDIWLSDEKGQNLKMIIKNGGHPHWSPDSQWLFHSNWENNHFYSMDRKNNYPFSFPREVGSFASFTPDGKKMLFYRPSYDMNWGLKIVSISGGPSFAPASGNQVYGAQWVSDSRRMLVQSEDENGKVLFKIIPLVGENPANVNVETNIVGKPFPFIASPDLSRISFTVKREDGRKDIYIAPFSIQQAKTTGPASLIFKGWSGGAYNVLFSWSPDGARIGLIHEDNIWIVPIESGSPVQMTNTSDRKRWIDWSPDGEKISYLTVSKRTGILHILPADGGISRVVSTDCRGSTWSPDSKNIVILSRDEIQIISLDGKKLKRVAGNQDLGMDQFNAPRYSPDGKHLALIGYDDDNSLIFLYSFATAKITRLADDNLNDYKYSLNWSPDGRWISYLTEEDVKVRPEGALWEADFEDIIEKIYSSE